MINVSVIGATGYAGVELVRLLKSHPYVNLANIVSQSNAGKMLSEIYPNFAGLTSQVCADKSLKEIAEDSDVVFVSLPHGVSSETVYELALNKNCKIIDLSGDFRYKDVTVYEKWYKTKHPHPELLESSVYGLPELHREKIASADIVANPGCYTTCSILALAPLFQNQAINANSVLIDAKSGVTGAGRAVSQNLHYCEVNENIKAYGLATHRHTSEIEQELSTIANEKIALSFTPHLIPINRGILCTIYANLNDGITTSEISDIYMKKYCEEPFVHIFENGLLPEVKYVNGSNRCQIGFSIDTRLNRIIIVSAIDNLIKGAGGQAIQNMNIMFNLAETAGLDFPGWYL